MGTYVSKRDYNALDPIAARLNEAEYALTRIRAAISALYPDNSQPEPETEDVNDAISDFERESRALIKELDDLIG